MSENRWLEYLPGRTAEFMQSLRVEGQAGRFLPCLKGSISGSDRATLGSSCFALKVYYTLGLWEELSLDERESWIGYVKSFQASGGIHRDPLAKDAFIDAPVVKHASKRTPWHRRLLETYTRPAHLSWHQQVILAETKQAIASLMQVGATAERPYRGFPATRRGITNRLRHLGWERPWAAGGQASALAMLVKTQSPLVLKRSQSEECIESCTRFFEGLAHEDTGAYFHGGVPEHGELINGAMKVLSALHWLQVPVHYPERLIDTCLERLPIPDGCHLVDSVYVLHRCSQQTRYMRGRIRDFGVQVLSMIKEHHNSDGGFSFHIGRAQRSYLGGIRVSRGLHESDIHGTCLLTWATAMILELLDVNDPNLLVIKP